MTRVLTFEGPKAGKRFELCRGALLSAGNGKTERTRETLRKEARIFDAFDAISRPTDPTPHDQDPRVLKDGAFTVTLAQEDHALLTLYVDTMPWAPRVCREALDTQDWLSAAEKVDA